MSDPVPQRRQYRKRPDQFVIAVRVDLDTEGFAYRKWGGTQRCKRGDWLVNNQGDLYTVDGEVFERTYREVDVGRYVKTTPIWADVASHDGRIVTKEGVTHYKAGDYLVSNNADGSDAYAVTPKKFEVMYEFVD